MTRTMNQFRSRGITEMGVDEICFVNRNAWLQKRVVTEGALRIQFLKLDLNVVLTTTINISIRKLKRRKTTMMAINQQIKTFSSTSF
jgi:hypothetical protein